MLRSKILLWITFDFCVTIGACVDLLGKIGNDITMNCTGAGNELEWKLDNNLLIGKSKRGIPRKGKIDTSLRSRIDNNKLKISGLKTSDSGVYTCGSSTYTLSMVSAQAKPSVVLHSRETTLSCDITGSFQGKFEWISPNNKKLIQSKDMTIGAVTSDDEGTWTCEIKNNKGVHMEKLTVSIAVVGPLITTKEVNASEGGSAELTCRLPAPSKLSITGSFWTHVSGVHISTLIKSESGIDWNSSHVSSDRVKFSNIKLTTDFSVTLEKVKQADAGVYTCNLEFQGGGSMSANLMLTVSERIDSGSGSPETKDSMWVRRFWGLQLWVWIAVVASSVVLIGLIIIIVLIHRRNKRMKMKVKKLRSMRQPLTSRNYCKCERTARQPGTGKRERPPPLPRNQYTSLNE